MNVRSPADAKRILTLHRPMTAHLRDPALTVGPVAHQHPLGVLAAWAVPPPPFPPLAGGGGGGWGGLGPASAAHRRRSSPASPRRLHRRARTPAPLVCRRPRLIRRSSPRPPWAVRPGTCSASRTASGRGTRASGREHRYSSSLARVMPTNASRRSSSTSSFTAQAALVRQDALLHRHQVDHRELQPLGGVQRHHRHAVLLLVPAVHVAGQGDVLQEVGRWCGWASSACELLGGRDEFLDVGQAFLVLRIGAVLQHLPIAASCRAPGGSPRPA